jgi:S1-C subfamily serine protease
MDYLDAIIIVLVVVYSISGYRRGLSWVALSLIGLLIGLLLGAVIAPPLSRLITHDRGTQPFFAIGLFLVIALLVQAGGTAIGYRFRLRTLRTRFALLDSSLGALLSIVGALVGAWYLGLAFSNSPWVGLDQQIKGSAIVRGLDSIVPRPPGFLAAIENILGGTHFPNPFSGIAPATPPPVDIPPLVNTPGIRQASSVTSKVIAFGCGGAEAGSSWPVATHYLVTNAHVVAGANRVEVDTTDGATHSVTVVLFDPNTDLAVLYAPDIDLPRLLTASSDPARGTAGAVIGYPGGESEQVVPAAVSGTELARGYNIYGDAEVTRNIEVLAAHVIPGNSGGPMVDNTGTVIGLVFAASTTDPNQGYALTIPQIAPDLEAGSGRTQPVSTEACTS